MNKMNDSFINELMMNILEGAKIPKVQVERELSPILGMFMGAILTKKFENSDVFSGEYQLITPEFPLKKDGNNQSTNIDYMLFNKTKKAMVLLELKTDPSSSNANQTDTYGLLKDKITESSAHFLKTDIDSIIQSTGKKAKYEYVAKRLEKTLEGEELSKINQCTVIYLVPNAIKEVTKNNKSVDYVLTFKDLPQHIEHDHADAWQIISQYLHELDDMYEPINETDSMDAQSMIISHIQAYSKTHPQLIPDFFQLGVLGSGTKPNYQVTFKCGAVQTFRFNGKPHHLGEFKAINLGDAIVL